MSIINYIELIIGVLFFLQKEMGGYQSGGYSGTGSKADLNNHSNQCNPNHSQFKGYSSGYSGTGTKPDLNNHSSQLNPNNSKYQSKK